MQINNSKSTPSKESSYNEYDDDNIPEIDLPKSSNATNTIPAEMPIRDYSRREK